MDCIFNELSAQPVDTVADACDAMANFVRAVGAVQSLGMRQVRIPEEFGKDLYSLPLAPAFTVGTWLNDERVDRDLRDRFRLIVANPPLLATEEVEALSMFEQSVFCLTEPAGKPEAKGFGAAHLSNRLLVSLLSHVRWDVHQLTGWHWYLDNSGQAQTEQVNVRNFATAFHVEQHKSWLQQVQEEQLKRSEEVWEKRAEFFPNLILCGEVKRQLERVGLSSYLTQIIDRLRTLDAYVHNWKSGSFDWHDLKSTTNLNVSPESASTLRQYSAQRKFKLPDGERRELFDLHIKVGDLRFHFYPDNQEKKVYVGYIGPHLRTATG